jgi:hypothetical protein
MPSAGRHDDGDPCHQGAPERAQSHRRLLSLPAGLRPQSPVHPVNLAEPYSACATVVAICGVALLNTVVAVLVVGALTVVVCVTVVVVVFVVGVVVVLVVGVVVVLVVDVVVVLVVDVVVVFVVLVVVVVRVVDVVVV